MGMVIATILCIVAGPSCELQNSSGEPFLERSSQDRFECLDGTRPSQSNNHKRSCLYINNAIMNNKQFTSHIILTTSRARGQ
ncbi:hypothetical protein GGR55DRAFT_89960 [Xylaria sp. FL0064]|nr:hypothetical protein GGR55DRAFT_89960 [Xylaria sp. FL0064]